jgi:YD repeat-containing protein
MRLPNRLKPKAGRVVRHTLADGTVKEYRYEPHGRKVRERAHDSTAALIAAYQRSPEWRALAAKTQVTYTIYLRPLFAVGHLPAVAWTRREILTLRDAIAGSRGNGAATGFMRATSALFTWAVDREWIEHTPVTRIKPLEGGHLPAWSRQEADAAEAGLPAHLARVVALARYTGQRRGDLCAMGWSAYDGATIRLVQHKTGAPLVLPVHPVLRAHLDGWPRVAATILVDGKGRPWKPEDLSHQMPRGLARIGLPDGLNVHGLRKLAAAELADAGCSMHEIAAVTGHLSLSMVQLYTKSADQERLASAAIIRLSEQDYKRTKKREIS